MSEHVEPATGTVLKPHPPPGTPTQLQPTTGAGVGEGFVSATTPDEAPDYAQGCAEVFASLLAETTRELGSLCKGEDDAKKGPPESPRPECDPEALQCLEDMVAQGEHLLEEMHDQLCAMLADPLTAPAL
ncbi:uncharacterized protein LOC144119017 [Amblyomma americanum]